MKLPLTFKKYTGGHKMDYYATVKEGSIAHKATWINLKIITLYG